jgi:hypothetical protein
MDVRQSLRDRRLESGLERDTFVQRRYRDVMER